MQPAPDAVAGAKLNAERTGTRTGVRPHVVLVHGFTQTGRSWGHFGELLELERELVRVDLPGHGDSAGVRADLAEAGNLVVRAGRAAIHEAERGLDATAAVAAGGGAGGGTGGDGERFDLIGYSLGARVALHAVLQQPGAVRRLVLIGGTAGIEDSGARADRRARDEAMAAALEADGDVERFLHGWLAAPMFSRLRDPGTSERLRNTAAGLASSLRLAGTGTQAPLWHRLPEITAPALLVAGADDLRFAAAASRMARAIPSAAFSLVPGAGHAAHLSQPGLTARIVRRFLED